MMNNNDYFNVSLTNCNYFGRDSPSSTLDMVAVGNIHLGLPGVSPHFLFSSQCIQLIKFYSMIFYNFSFNDMTLHDLNIELPVSKSAFIHRLNEIIVSKVPLPPTFFIVNASDGLGTHWFVVVLDIPSATINED